MNHSGTNDVNIQIFTPIKAMRKKCLDCCCGSPQEVKLCPVKDCALYPYRLGKHPKRTGTKGQVNPGLQKFQRIAKGEIAKKGERKYPGLRGIHHGVSPKHLLRYLAEFC